MINKLSLLCLSGFLVTSAHASVMITCTKNPYNASPAEFTIFENADGYMVSTLYAGNIPQYTHYKVRDRSASVHQAAIHFDEASHGGRYTFSLYYPATNERQVKKGSTRDKTTETKVSVQYKNYMITPTNPEKAYPVVSNASYKVSSYNLSHVRLYDSIERDSHVYHDCTFKVDG